jgi:SnoaL-like domain
MHATRVVLSVSVLALFGSAGLLVNHPSPPSANVDSQKAGNQRDMSHSVSTLLTRNLNDVFGENDQARRRKAIGEIFAEDVVFYDPMGGVFRGRDEIDGIAAKLRAMHPDFRYQPIGKPEEVGNAGRVRWTEGRPGEAPAVAGTDFIITRDGRIAAIYLFFDKP